MSLKNLAHYEGTFCPILSFRENDPVPCTPKCEWFNKKNASCDVTAIADLLFHEPETKVIQRRNDQP